MRARRRTWSSLGASNGNAIVYVTLGPDPPTTASSLNFSAADFRALKNPAEASFISSVCAVSAAGAAETSIKYATVLSLT